jgi:hypothetical protein
LNVVTYKEFCFGEDVQAISNGSVSFLVCAGYHFVCVDI